MPADNSSAARLDALTARLDAFEAAIDGRLNHLECAVSRLLDVSTAYAVASALAGMHTELHELVAHISNLCGVMGTRHAV